MPIFQLEGSLIYFAHVPKCAGTAMEDYLARRFGPLGFLCRDHHKLPAEAQWNRSSPQHVDRQTLSRLFPAQFFRAKFSIVRHPVDRIRSVFLFQRDVEKKISMDQSFSGWLQMLEARRAEDPFYLDNHVRPMSEFIPKRSRIFRLEDGTRNVITWLDKLAGNLDGPRHLPVLNSRADKTGQEGPRVQIGDDDLKLISQLYVQDFRRFQYSLKEIEALL